MPPSVESRRQFLTQDITKLLAALAGAAVAALPLTRKFAKEAGQGQIYRPQEKESGQEKSAEINEEPKVAALEEETKITGREFLENLGLLGKIVYLVYGRPGSRGLWGTLGSSTTAAESWELAEKTRKTVSQSIDLGEERFAYTIINPIYYSGTNWDIPLKDGYVESALEEAAKQSQRMVAFDFCNIEGAQKLVLGLEERLSSACLSCLAVSFDVEHFEGDCLEAGRINEFSQWFLDKHQGWSKESRVGRPGFVFVYTFGLGKIINPEQLQQYYPEQAGLVVPIFSGKGDAEVKRVIWQRFHEQFVDSPDYPALFGAMEFWTKWRDKYDKGDQKTTYEILSGEPAYFFSSQ